jgi:hypothetical protein
MNFNHGRDSVPLSFQFPDATAQMRPNPSLER